MSDESSSISAWIERLRHSDEQAARLLWERFRARMLAVARQRRGQGGVNDADDAALSAFADLVRAVKAGRFPNLHDRDGLWALLCTFTQRKARDHARHEQRARRGGGKVGGGSALEAGDPREPADDEPSPDEAVAFQDELAWLLGELPSDEVRAVVLLKMQGHDNDAIATELGCSRATVERRFRLVRQTWRWLRDEENAEA